MFFFTILSYLLFKGTKLGEIVQYITYGIKTKKSTSVFFTYVDIYIKGQNIGLITLFWVFAKQCKR